ncbi:HEL181Wp [Eremothecium sinecaudum]|uniref:P-type Na(+) transporter n=1 Tax=Eremothecium sinecaudum TaxID=45286 RepID=A0A0X8HTB9_9SACH|nr:HEL181Wp [Eremothecium sinecaudum]AMD21100.1 HEL181Wp [Eremothecium sinecaudum]
MVADFMNKKSNVKDTYHDEQAAVYYRGDFHSLSIHEVEQLLKTNIRRGLSSEDVEGRLAILGPNSFGEESGINFVDIVMRQVFNAMILVLFISMVICLGIRDWISGGVIAFVVLINVAVGGYQDYKACKTMDSLKSLSTPSAHVIRNGEDTVIPSHSVVPGDICVLKVGDTIPADLRLIESTYLETDETLLTGESLPVAKDHLEVFPVNTPVGDRLNLAFASSAITKGRAVGIVIKTGLETEVGKIAKSLKGEKRQSPFMRKDKNFVQNTIKAVTQPIGRFLGFTVGTPLQQKLSKFAVLLFVIAVILAIIVMGVQRFVVTKEVAVYAICVALSMIPSSLVVVLTITMSVGARVMSTRNVIVRNLESLETLGSVDDICSDKTGTLTQGKMIARQVWVPTFGTIIVDSSNSPYDPTEGEISLIPKFSPWEYQHDETEDVGIIKGLKKRLKDGTLPAGLDARLLERWLHTATLANIASVLQDNTTGEWKAHGDPTEIAIQVFTTRLDLPREALVLSEIDESTDGENESCFSSQGKRYRHLAEFPFDSSVKRMSSVYLDMEEGNTHCIFTKGAFERVLSRCTKWCPNIDNGTAQDMTEEALETIKQNVETLSADGLRVLAFARKTFTEAEAKELGEKLTKDREFVESDLIFQGLIGIYDPPRPESADAVKRCHRAGVNVHMLTGDFPGTAKSIAQEVNILPHNLYHYPKEVVDSMVMTAAQFDSLSDEEIDALPLLPLVIARCAPETKVRMIDALHRRGKFCAMTGDGVNDSPSLKKADVGIAIGKNGSDIAKEASDIVLSDDNFASILNAVEEGRRMSDNIQKFVLQLLAVNVAQCLYLMVGLVFMDQDRFSVFPISPVEALWIIVVTSCFPAMGLGLEKAAPDIMEKPPRDSNAGVFTWEVIVDMIVYGVALAACCFACFVIVIYKYGGGELGHNCNTTFDDVCADVFKARAVTFATLTWGALILAWEVIDMRRSLFAMVPETETPYTQVFRDLWSNQFLFWSVIFGFVSVFPVVYIPVVNTRVFLHSSISYEWGFAFAFLIAFWTLIEFYKYLKRRYYRNKDRAINPESDLERNRVHDPFEKYTTTYSRTTPTTYAFPIEKDALKEKEKDNYV